MSPVLHRVLFMGMATIIQIDDLVYLQLNLNFSEPEIS